MNTLTCTDNLLVERCQNGDEGAFNELLDRHHDRAYRLAYRLTHDTDEAGDVVAETMVRIYKGIPNFRGTSSFTTWMYRITRNCFLDIKKKKQQLINIVSSDHVDETESAYQYADQQPSPYDIAAANEQIEGMGAAIRKLLSWQQTILLMRYSEMKSYEEIADLMDLPIGTVKSRISRARERLLKILEVPNRQTI